MENTKHKYVRVVGRVKSNGRPEKRIYIYERNSIHSPAIGWAMSTDLLPYLGQEDADPHMYKVLYPTNKSSVGYVTSNERYTEVIYKA